MGAYDRAITVFSPDGHLLQVQYASEAATRGLSAVAIKGKDCIIILAEKRLKAKLQESESIRKIITINSRVVCTFAGLAADGMALIRKVKNEAQNYMLSSNRACDVEYVAKYVSSLQQKYTIKGGARPFGITCLVCGFNDDDEPFIFKCEPHGVLFKWKAHAIGSGFEAINAQLDKLYKDDMDIEELKKTLVSVVGKNIEFSEDNADIAVITKKTDERAGPIKVDFLSGEEIAQYKNSVSDSNKN